MPGAIARWRSRSGFRMLSRTVSSKKCTNSSELPGKVIGADALLFNMPGWVRPAPSYQA